jgi:crotonobetainyl-CoA:carnitine CoA-transferase CaiB-like acyl-CoA transferase
MALGPLEGLRIIDMTSVIMGPYATQILADYGADVIHVEPPEGDVLRNSGPMREPNMAANFVQLNRNKRSLVLDLKHELGKKAFLRLCEGADVFVHNVRTAAMRRLGLCAADVQAGHPRLIYVSLTGYGEDGPYAGRPAYDDLIQGITALPGLAVQSGGSEPRYVPLNLADRAVGLHAVHAILAAVISRDRTGVAAAVDVSMFEAMAQFVLSDHLGGRAFVPQVGETGYSRLLASNRRPYRTQDGYVCVLIYNDKQWEAFFRAIGRSEQFATDARLNTHKMRAAHFNEVYGIAGEIFLERTSAAWLELLTAHDVPCVPYRTLDELISDEHLAAVGFFTNLPSDDGGEVRYVGAVGRWSEDGPRVRTHAPRLGEQSIEILREAGMSPDEISQLIAAGASVEGPAHV